MEKTSVSSRGGRSVAAREETVLRIVNQALQFVGMARYSIENQGDKGKQGMIQPREHWSSISLTQRLS